MARRDLVRRVVALALLAGRLGLATAASGSTGVAKSTGPPSFFLQDPNDGLCLSGPEFKRCALDTLWYVTGRPGNYQLHHRKVEEVEDELCLDKVNCHLPESATRLGSCKHCGAKKWNILGDQESGYVLSEDGGKNCLSRDGTKVKMGKCDDGYSSMTLQFATRDDIKVMESPGARLITAAADGDKPTVKEYLDDGVDVNSQDWDNLTALIAASSSGHLDIVKLVVQKGADVNARDKDNITALMEAAIMGHKDVADFLVQKQKAIVDAPAASGVTALWLAAGEGRTDIVQFLIKHGADVNNKRMDGITALMAACVGGHLAAAKLLVQKGSDVHAVDQDGLSAIMNAAENGSTSVVSYLIDNGASPSNMSTTGFTPLIVAAAGGHLGVVELLIKKGAKVDAMHPEGVNALMYAAAGGHEQVVDFLIAQGADVNALHSNGGSALMEAATAGNVSVVKKLIDHKADAQIKDKDQVTALMSAASQGHLEVSKLLIEVGVEVDAVAASGGTALMFAAGAGYKEVCELLIKHKANVNKKVQATPEYIDQVAEAIAKGDDVEPHKDGVTSLHVAALGGHLEVCKLLLEHGAEPRAKDDEDQTPLLNAVSGNFGDVAFALVEQGADPNDVYIDEDQRAHNLLWDSVYVGNARFATLLVQRGADLSHRDDHNVTVLIQAAHKGQKDVVDALVERQGEIDTSAFNDEGYTALIAAAAEGHHEICKMLIERTTVDVNAKDKDGTNALMAAAVRGHNEVVDVLLAHKAEVNAQNEDGHTALMFAYNGRNQVASLLDKYSEYMKDQESDNSTAIIQKALETHSSIVDTLIAHGADISLQDKKGNVAIDFDYQKKDPADEAKPGDAGKSEL